jgi:hypothetical protein
LFDWVAVTFENADPDGVMGPAKILAFYKDGEGVDCAVVHATHLSTRRETKVGNTMLIQNSRLEFNPLGAQPCAQFEWTKSTEDSWFLNT